MKLSIYIPVFNQRDELRRTLRALIPEKNGHEIVVVDRGSSDDSQEVLKDFDWATLVESSEKRLCPALNEAVKGGESDVLFFLKPGAIPARGWTQTLEESVGKDLDAGHFHTREADTPFAWAEGLRSAIQKVGQQVLGGPSSLNGVAVKRSTFETAEGFSPVPDFEWLAFAKRLRASGATVKPIKHQVWIAPAPGSRHTDAWQELKDDFLAAWRYRKTENFDPVRCRRRSSAVILFGYDVFPGGDVNDYYDYARDELMKISLEMVQSYRGADRIYFIGGTKSTRLIGQPSGVEVVGNPGDDVSKRFSTLLSSLQKQETEAVMLVRGISGELTHASLRELAEGEAEAPCRILPEQGSNEWLALWLDKTALDALDGWEIEPEYSSLQSHLKSAAIRHEVEAGLRCLRTDSDARAMYYAGILDRLPA